MKHKITMTKSACYQDPYDKLDTREGEHTVYHVACRRNATMKGIQVMKTIKDANGMAL